MPPISPSFRPRVSAVSYLNTVPLVWGMLHGPQRGVFDLSFSVPSECAEQLQSGDADIGIVPAVEIPRLGLEFFRGTGIACRGPVRSILLISKVPFAEIRTLAADSGSRTSVMLSRILLNRNFGADPAIVRQTPVLDSMLAEADAALIIGDPALRIDPQSLPYRALDLGALWVETTGLPMVFAVWSGRPEIIREPYEQAFLGSARFGLDRIEEIVAREHGPRGISAELARRYLTEHIAFELGDREYQGLDLFLKYAQELEPARASA